MLIGVLSSALLACGGEVPGSPGGRIDVSLDGSQCKSSCTIAKYRYWLTPPGSFSCFYQSGHADAGKEVVLSSFTPPSGDKVGLLVVGYCESDDDCPRCFSTVEVALGDGVTRTARLTSIPFCVASFILPSTRCPG